MPYQTQPLPQSVYLAEYLFKQFFFHMGKLFYMNMVVRWVSPVNHGYLMPEAQLHQIVVRFDDLLVKGLVEYVFFPEYMDSTERMGRLNGIVDSIDSSEPHDLGHNVLDVEGVGMIPSGLNRYIAEKIDGNLEQQGVLSKLVEKCSLVLSLAGQVLPEFIDKAVIAIETTEVKEYTYLHQILGA